MEVLDVVGVKVDYKTARDIFREAGAQVDEHTQSVRIPEKLVRWAASCWGAKRASSGCARTCSSTWGAR